MAPFINKETEPILMYDPLPPIDSINIYKRPILSTASRLLPDASPFSMFFQSILPNFNVQDGTFVAPEAVAAAGGGGGGAAANNPVMVIANENHEALIQQLGLIDDADGKSIYNCN